MSYFYITFLVCDRKNAFKMCVFDKSINYLAVAKPHYRPLLSLVVSKDDPKSEEDTNKFFKSLTPTSDGKGFIIEDNLLSKAVRIMGKHIAYSHNYQNMSMLQNITTTYQRATRAQVCG